MLEKGGWHFSKIYDVNTLTEKIRFSAHTEFNNSEINETTIKEDLENKTIPYGRKFKGTRHDLNEDFPKYILKNKSKFKDYLIDE